LTHFDRVAFLVVSSNTIKQELKNWSVRGTTGIPAQLAQFGPYSPVTKTILDRLMAKNYVNIFMSLT